MGREKKNFSSWKGGWVGVGLWGERGIAVFRERPGDDVEGREKEDLGQIIIYHSCPKTNKDLIEVVVVKFYLS